MNAIYGIIGDQGKNVYTHNWIKRAFQIRWIAFTKDTGNNYPQ